MWVDGTTYPPTLIDVQELNLHSTVVKQLPLPIGKHQSQGFCSYGDFNLKFDHSTTELPAHMPSVGVWRAGVDLNHRLPSKKIPFRVCPNPF